MICRRDFLITTASTLLLPYQRVLAEIGQNTLGWQQFQDKMSRLAEATARGLTPLADTAQLGLDFLSQLDIHSDGFRKAVEQSFESGNRYWLWQRLFKQQHIKGGILNIENDQIVQLHDHPNAIGMVRIISGETEVWQYDLHHVDQGNALLKRVNHTVLKAGDMAVLTPDKGNIHALLANTPSCRMLDFFIPPYDQSQRHWYKPLHDDWKNQAEIICQQIAQHDYLSA